MTASEHLNGYQFEHVLHQDEHTLIAYTGNPHAEDSSARGRAGDIRWHKDTGEITSLYIKPSHRRKGLATALYNDTAKHGVAAVHSDSRSVDGDAWAAKAGGHVPPLRQRVDYTT